VNGPSCEPPTACTQARVPRPAASTSAKVRCELYSSRSPESTSSGSGRAANRPAKRAPAITMTASYLRSV